MIQYYKDTPEGIIWYSGFIMTQEKQIINPSPKDIENDGWIPFNPTSPSLYTGEDPLPEDIYLKCLFGKHPECKDLVKLIKSGYVYHYSTWETLFKGILSSENINKGRAILRAYSVNYMNDSLEGLLIPRGVSDSEEREVARKYYQIMEAKEGEKFKAPDTRSTLRKSLFERSAHQAKQYLFSVSFSKNPDSLPMWNYYGHDGHGLSIGFDAQSIVYQGYDIVECIYEKVKMGKLAECIYDSIDQVPRLLPQTIDLSLIAKDSHFEYEHECRIPLRKHYGQYCITKRNQFHPIKYDMKKGIISPYVDVFVPIDAIQEIWIGPTNDIDLAEDSLRGWLRSIGLTWVEIKISSAPFR